MSADHHCERQWCSDRGSVSVTVTVKVCVEVRVIIFTNLGIALDRAKTTKRETMKSRRNFLYFERRFLEMCCYCHLCCFHVFGVVATAPVCKLKDLERWLDLSRWCTDCPKQLSKRTKGFRRSSGISRSELVSVFFAYPFWNVIPAQFIVIRSVVRDEHRGCRH